MHKAHLSEYPTLDAAQQEVKKIEETVAQREASFSSQSSSQTMAHLHRCPLQPQVPTIDVQTILHDIMVLLPFLTFTLVFPTWSTMARIKAESNELSSVSTLDFSELIDPKETVDTMVSQLSHGLKDGDVRGKTYFSRSPSPLVKPNLY